MCLTRLTSLPQVPSLKIPLREPQHNPGRATSFYAVSNYFFHIKTQQTIPDMHEENWAANHFGGKPCQLMRAQPSAAAAAFTSEPRMDRSLDPFRVFLMFFSEGI